MTLVPNPIPTFGQTSSNPRSGYSVTVNQRKARTQRNRRLPPPPVRGRHRGGSPLVQGWRQQPMSMRLLRAFLGVTFMYAGVQKMADPNFLHPGTPDFIGSQLAAFAHGSPIGGVLRALAQVPVPVGLAIAFAEIAIGLGTLVGIGPVLMGVGGFLVNLALTLSATWHVHPYFLGSDSIYAVAWLAYLLGLVELGRRARGRAAPTVDRIHTSDEIGRRELIRGGVLAGATLLAASAGAAVAGKPAAALSAGLKQRRPGRGQDGVPSQDPTGNGSSGSSSQGPGVSSSQGSSQGSGGPSPSGTTIATLSSLPVGGAVGFNDPGVGPAALIRLGQDRVVAYSRVCTHAGCLVGYDASQQILYCPCHGAEYDPAHHAEVIAGPAPSPLPPIKVEIDPATGTVILPS